MLTDKFRVSGIAPINNTAGSLKEMREILRDLLGNLTPEKTEEANILFKDTLKSASSIEIDGKVVWDRTNENLPQDLETKWEIGAKNRLEKAKNLFEAFPNADPKMVATFRSALYGLNENIWRSAKVIVEKNYRANGDKVYDFYFYPFPPNGEVKLKKQGLLFTYEALCHTPFLKDGAEFFELDSNSTRTLLATGKPTSTHPICTTLLTVTLDFTNYPKEFPRATFDMAVTFHSSEFEYCGPQWLPEIISLETRLNKGLLNSIPLETLKINANIKLGLSAGELAKIGKTKLGEISKTISIEESVQSLALMLQLFNQAMKAALLELKKENKDEEMIEAELPELITSNLKEFTISDLAAITKVKIANIFDALEAKEIASLIKVIFNSFISQARESAIFLSKSPEAYLNQSGKYIINKELLICAFDIIALSIDTIKSALEYIIRKNKVEIFGFPEEHEITDIVHVPTPFQEFFSSVMQNQLETHNPFQDQYIHPKFLKFIKELSIGSEGPSLLAKSIIKSERENKRNLEEIKLNEPEEAPQILYFNPPPFEERMRCWGNSEAIAALWGRHPLIEALNDGPAIEFSARLILSLYPNIETILKPYFPLLGTSGAIVGSLVARDAILHPRKIMNPSVRIWKAGTNGLVMLVFGLGSAINIYLFLNPENQHVSNKTFWSEIASGPLAMSAFCALWHSISPNTKRRWFSPTTPRRHIATALDITSRALFYNGIFYISLLNFFKTPGNLMYQFLPSIPGTLIAMLEQPMKYKERIKGVMTYLISANFSFSIAQQLINQIYSSDKSEENKISSALLYSQAIMWGFFVFYWTYFLLTKMVSFTREYQGDPEIIIQNVPRDPFRSNREGSYLSIGEYKQLQSFKNIPIETKEAEEITSKQKNQLIDKLQELNPTPPLTIKFNNDKKRQTASSLEKGASYELVEKKQGCNIL